MRHRSGAGSSGTAPGWDHDGLWKRPKVDDTLKAVRLELHRDLDSSFFKGVDFGVNHSKRRIPS